MTQPDLYRIWVYLSSTPLLWLTLTLVAFAIGDGVSAALRRNPLANPVVIAAGLLILLLAATGTTYQTYFQGAQFVHFLLGPATVALGLPLWRNRVAVRRNLLPMAVSEPATRAAHIGRRLRRTATRLRQRGRPRATVAGPRRKCTNWAPWK